MPVESHEVERRHFHSRLSRKCAPRFEREVLIMSTFGLRTSLIAFAAFIGLALTTNPAFAQYGGGGQRGGGGSSHGGSGGGFHGGGGGGFHGGGGGGFHGGGGSFHGGGGPYGGGDR